MDFARGLLSKARPPPGGTYVSTLFSADDDDVQRLNPPRPNTVQTLNNPRQRPRPKAVLPVWLRPWFVWGIITLMLVLVAGIEILVRISEKSNGWRVFGLVDFGGINFLKSAIPVLLTSPISAALGKTDEALAGMHAYLVLAKGRAPAEKSLLLSYSGSRWSIMFRSLLNSHWLVLFSSIILLATNALDPLVSGILTSRGTGVVVPNVPVTSIKSLGTIADLSKLETFLGAAGYATAAAMQNLADPPFVHKTWAVASFVIPPQPGSGMNGTVVVPTTGVFTSSGCGGAVSSSATPGTGGVSIQATWETCSVQFSVPAATSDTYGVQAVSGCTGVQTQKTDFLPVVFWFLSGADNRQVGLTFCQPTAQAFNVIATADLGTGLLGSVEPVDQNVPSNNFTGPPQNGQTCNGVAFDLTGADTLTQARAIAIQTTLPDAIYRTVKAFPGGLQAMLANNNGAALVEATNKTYTQFLSAAAQQTYFLDSISTINASQINWELRLWVYPVAAHSYAAALLLIALLAIGVHIAHAKARRDVYLSADPATMAATLSMTSESSFPKLLHAGDTEEEMEKTLKGMRFGISRRTWQVVVEGGEEDRYQMTDFKDDQAYPAYGSGMPYGLPSAADSRSSFTTVVPSTYNEGGNVSGKPVDPWAKAR